MYNKGCIRSFFSIMNGCSFYYTDSLTTDLITTSLRTRQHACALSPSKRGVLLQLIFCSFLLDTCNWLRATKCLPLQPNTKHLKLTKIKIFQKNTKIFKKGVYKARIMCYYTVKESYEKFPLSWETGKTRKFQSVYKGESLLHIMEYIKNFLLKRSCS